MKRFVLILGLLAAASTRAGAVETLETPNYLVTIEQRCAEGNVSCDDVVYTGKSKRSGKAITLRGKTMHSTCADGVTPCRFQGYQFRSGKVRYIVGVDGSLTVQQGSKTLVNERGEWK